MKMATNKYYYVYTHSVDGKVFYIGKGCEGRAFTKEGRNNLWKDFVTSLTHYDIDIIKEFECSADALLFEEDLIIKMNPKCNKVHKIVQREPSISGMIDQTDWPKIIKQLNGKGLTQSDISEKTGVDQGKISKLLNGADIYYDGGTAIMKLLRGNKK